MVLRVSTIYQFDKMKFRKNVVLQLGFPQFTSSTKWNLYKMSFMYNLFFTICCCTTWFSTYNLSCYNLVFYNLSSYNMSFYNLSSLKFISSTTWFSATLVFYSLVFYNFGLLQLGFLQLGLQQLGFLQLGFLQQLISTIFLQQFNSLPMNILVFDIQS
jgi:hypothetical protein